MSKRYDRNWKCKCQRIEYSTYTQCFNKRSHLILQYWDNNIPFGENDWQIIFKQPKPKDFRINDMYNHQLHSHKHDYCNEK